MKSLIIYYSKTGNTKLMAEKMAEALEADLLKIQPQKEIKSTGFMLYFRGGFQSMTKRNIKLEKPTLNLDNYDLIIIGSPVWAWRLNPVVRSFLKQHDITNKKIGLYCCCADNAEGVLSDMKEILAENDILGEEQFIEPLKNDTADAITKAKEWAQKIHSLAKK